MNRFTNTLGRVQVAAPCEEGWDEMRGDERVRFCARCSLNVFNLSAMTRREAERLVLNAEGRLCVRFYRRRDGTMLTQNCPVGLIKLKRRISRAANAVAAAAACFLAGVGVSAVTGRRIERVAPPPVVVTAEQEPLEEVLGATSSVISPAGEQVVVSGVAASLLFLAGYPLLKLKERREGRLREELRIWRNV
jgi:hypothetical protein